MHVYMMRETRLALTEDGYQFANGKVTVAQQRQDAQAGRLTCRPQGFNDYLCAYTHIII